MPDGANDIWGPSGLPNPVLRRLPRPAAQPAEHRVPIFVVIPIAIVLVAVNGEVLQLSFPSHNYGVTLIPAGSGGALVIGPFLMILFSRKYPRWWFDWNLELQRFINRAG